MSNVFEPADFDAFEEHKWRKTEFNAERLIARRKLSDLAAALRGRLAAAGLDLVEQVSIHHPYIFNRFRVDALWGYFSRGEAERKGLRRILGVEFGKDLDANYTHAILVVGLDLRGFEAGFKIHAQAWWDGQNLKNRCARPEGRAALHAILRGLPPGFFLTIHDWQREYPCRTLLEAELDRYLELYTPGTHWFHLRRRTPRGEAEGMAAPDLAERFSEDLLAASALYRFAAWSEKNNFVFSGKVQNP